MHVRGFPPHIVEKPRFIPFLGQGSKFDARTIGRQPPNQPVPVKTHEVVLDADRTLDQLRAVNIFG